MAVPYRAMRVLAWKGATGPVFPPNSFPERFPQHSRAESCLFGLFSKAKKHESWTPQRTRRKHTPFNGHHTRNHRERCPPGKASVIENRLRTVLLVTPSNLTSHRQLASAECHILRESCPRLLLGSHGGSPTYLKNRVFPAKNQRIIFKGSLCLW